VYTEKGDAQSHWDPEIRTRKGGVQGQIPVSTLVVWLPTTVVAPMDFLVEWPHDLRSSGSNLLITVAMAGLEKVCELGNLGKKKEG
jgi:hypothetical protein